jgi:hypothetical protein
MQSNSKKVTYPYHLIGVVISSNLLKWNFGKVEVLVYTIEYNIVYMQMGIGCV